MGRLLVYLGLVIALMVIPLDVPIWVNFIGITVSIVGILVHNWPDKED